MGDSNRDVFLFVPPGPMAPDLAAVTGVNGDNNLSSEETVRAAGRLMVWLLVIAG